MKVENMTSSRTGRAIPNQFIITDSENRRIFFQSYDSIIAKKEYINGCIGEFITLDRKYWNYSVTTSKYRSQFLSESTKETEQKIKDGIYKLEDLNA